MPIRLNLLAEAQAAEEVRRRDPVKRVIWVAALLVCLMLVWWSMLLLKAGMARNEIGRLEAAIASQTNECQKVLDNQKKVEDMTRKLSALQQLATNRFLNGSLLNAMQHSMVDGIRLTHLKVEQNYTITEGTKPRTINNRTVPGSPPTIAERITLVLDGKDSSPNPGDLTISRFRHVIASNDYVKGLLGDTNEVSLIRCSAPQGLAGEMPFVLFTVQCALPEEKR